MLFETIHNLYGDLSDPVIPLNSPNFPVLQEDFESILNQWKLIPIKPSKNRTLLKDYLGYIYVSTCIEAVQIGRLDCLRYMHEHGCSLSEETICTCAVQCGELACLTYLIDHGCLIRSTDCETAVVRGDLKILMCLHEHGCPFNERITETAAVNGRLGCLEYLHKKGCSLPKEGSCACISNIGSVECLRYLHENGCYIGDEACDTSIIHGNIDCLEYILEHYLYYDYLHGIKLVCNQSSWPTHESFRYVKLLMNYWEKKILF